MEDSPYWEVSLPGFSSGTSSDDKTEQQASLASFEHQNTLCLPNGDPFWPPLLNEPFISNPTCVHPNEHRFVAVLLAYCICTYPLPDNCGCRISLSSGIDGRNGLRRRIRTPSLLSPHSPPPRCYQLQEWCQSRLSTNNSTRMRSYPQSLSNTSSSHCLPRNLWPT